MILAGVPLLRAVFAAGERTSVVKAAAIRMRAAWKAMKARPVADQQLLVVEKKKKTEFKLCGLKGTVKAK